MKKIKRLLIFTVLILLILQMRTAQAAEAEEKALTLMIYMCGTNLESEHGAASKDLDEILKSDVNTDRVNVIIMTGGTKNWGKSFGLDEETSIVRIKSGQLITKKLGAQMNMGEPETLRYFIEYATESYPAEQYALILWNHGEGPLGSICLDELNDLDGLTLSELTAAMDKVQLDEKLSWIGFDACLMCSAEVAFAMSPYAEYMVASQETEPANGWNYQFLKGIENDAGGAETGRRIIDLYFDGENKDRGGMTLSCLDLSVMKELSDQMSDFFRPLGRRLDETLFSKLSDLRKKSADFGSAVRSLTDTSKDLVDLRDLIGHYQEFGDVSSIEAVLDRAIVYSRPNNDKAYGLSVYHVLDNQSDYLSTWNEEYSAIKFSEGYQSYLSAFGKVLTGEKLADWEQLFLSDDGYGLGMENLYSLGLTEEQISNFASAQLIILGSMSESYESGAYDVQLAESGIALPENRKVLYYPVWSDRASLEDDGRIHASFGGQSLYLTDGYGQALAGPVAYEISDDGKEWYIRATYQDDSAEENLFPTAEVLYTCVPNEKSGELSIVSTKVYDSATGTFTTRIGLDAENYTDMYLDRMTRVLPDGTDSLPGFELWPSRASEIAISLPLDLHFEIIDDQLSGTQLYATIEITDTQRNTYCTPLVRVQNPNLYDVGFSPRTYKGEDYDLTLYAVMDNSQLTPGLSLGVELRNTSSRTITLSLSGLTVNGKRALHPTPLTVSAKPGETGYDTAHIDLLELIGIKEVTELEFAFLSIDVRSDQEAEGIRFRCDLSGCINKNAGLSSSLISSWEKEKVRWELVSLTKTLNNELEAVVHIINEGKEPFKASLDSFVINDRVQIEADSLFIDVPDSTDSYYRLVIRNSVELRGIEVTERSNRRVLGESHILERFGIREIRKVELVLSSASELETKRSEIPFELNTSFLFTEQDEEDDALYFLQNDPRGLMLDDGITVQVERVLVGDSRLAFRMILSNVTERDIDITFIEPRVNGTGDDYSFFHPRTDEYAVYHLPERCSMIICDSFPWIGTTALSDFSMAFRYEDFTSERATVSFAQPVQSGKSGGVYLSPSEFAANTVRHGRPDFIRILPAMAETEYGNVTLSIGIENTTSLVYDGIIPENPEYLTKVRLNFSVTERNDRVTSYSFDRFFLNGSRMITEPISRNGWSDNWYLTVGQSYDEPYLLTNLGELSEISCVMTVKDRDGAITEIPLGWKIEECDLTGLCPVFRQPIAASDINGISYELLSVMEREGYSGQWYFVLHIRNHSDKPFRFSRVSIDGNQTLVLRNSENLSYFDTTLEPGKECYTEIRLFDISLDNYYLYNMASVGCPLQDEDGHYLHEIKVFTGLMEETATLGFTAPNSFSGRIDPIIAAAMDNQRQLLDDEIEVGLVYAMPGDRELVLVLSLHNKTDDLQRLDLRPSDEYTHVLGAYGHYELKPHTTRLETLKLSIRDGYSPKMPIGIAFSNENGTDYGTAVLWSEIPLMTDGSLRPLPGNNYVSIPAGEHAEDGEVNSPQEDRQITFTPVLVIRNTETDEWREVVGEANPSELNSLEVFEPALKICNLSDQPVSFGMHAIINGSRFSWPSFTVEAGEYYVAYTIGAEAVEGKYDSEFYVNGILEYSGALYVEEPREQSGNVFTFQNGSLEFG